MLDIVGGKSKFNWSETWKKSEESRSVKAALDRMNTEKQDTSPNEEGSSGESAMPLTSQIYHVTVRVFQQYWRTPTYISSKFLLGIAAALFIGFSFFLQNNSSTGMQNTIFSIFMLTSIFSTLVQQVCRANSILWTLSFSIVLILTDHASFCHPTLPLRSPRAPMQGLFLDCIHFRQHLRRNTIPDRPGHPCLGSLVFRYLRSPTNTRNPRHHAPLRDSIHGLQLYLRPHDHRGIARCRNGRQHRHAAF